MRRCKSIMPLVALAGVLAFHDTTLGQLERLKELARSTQTPTKKIAHFTIKGALAETPVDMPPLFSNEPPLSLKDLLMALKQARTDENIVAVVIDLQEAQLGFAQLEELRDAMAKFKAVDKNVYVHADTLTTGTYAVAAGASHVSMVPTGDLWLSGMYAETPYVRGGLEKLGIVPDFEQCGNYKTGAETLTRTAPSEPGHEMMNWLFDSIYETVVSMIAESRGLKPERVRELIDGGPYSAEEALGLGLIDSLQHRQDFADELKKRFGDSVEVVHDYGIKDEEEIPDNIFAAFEMLMKLFYPSPKTYKDPTIAIVYVEGLIQGGAAESSPFGQASGAFSTTIRRALDKAAEEDMVKAVVMRIDSPGGSALASEIILDASRRVAAKKPLIVSMGNVAGSGGYYVTCASETIFADRGTLTASIGVLGGKLVTTGFWDKLGINWQGYKRGEMADLLGTAEPFNDAQRAKIRHLMETVYATFKGHVEKSRGDRLTKPIDELAGGRVFTGAQALELGLVDKIGGLEEAIKFAADTARLSDYELRVIPEPPSFFDLLTGGPEKDEFLRGRAPRIGTSLLEAPAFAQMWPVLSQLDPLRCRALWWQLRKLEMLHEEHVLMAVPFELLVR